MVSQGLIDIDHRRMSGHPDFIQDLLVDAASMRGLSSACF